MPELTPEQKAQLDKNIRAMISQGASESDVMSYANDFRLKYDPELKKKEPSTPSIVSSIGAKIGGEAGTSVPQSVEQRLTDFIQGTKTKPTKEDYATAIAKGKPVLLKQGQQIGSDFGQQINKEAEKEQLISKASGIPSIPSIENNIIKQGGDKTSSWYENTQQKYSNKLKEIEDVTKYQFDNIIAEAERQSGDNITVPKDKTSLPNQSFLGVVGGNVTVDRKEFIKEWQTKKQEWLKNENVEVEKLKTRADQALDATTESMKPILEYAANNLSVYSKKNNDGVIVADPNEIDKLAQRTAAKYGVAGDGLYKKLIYNKITENINHAIIKPEVDKVFESKVKDAFGGKSLDDVMGDEYKAQVENLSEVTKITNSTKNDISVVSEKIKQDAQGEVGRINELAKAEIEEIKKQYNEVANTATTQEELDNTNAIFNKRIEEVGLKFLSDQNEINSRFNKIYTESINGITRVATKRLEDIAKSFKYKPSDELQAKIKNLYNDSYTSVIDKRGEAAEIRDAKKTWIGEGIAKMTTQLGGAIKNQATSLGWDAGEIIGDVLSSSYTPSSSELDSWKDIFNPRKLVTSGMSLAGGMLPTIAGTAAVTATTGGAGTPAALRMALAAITSFTFDTAQQMGSVWNEKFSETGNLSDANKAAKTMLDGQKAIMWTYAGSGLPFMGSSVKLAKNRAARVLLGIGIQHTSETGQEWFQDAVETAAIEGKSLKDAMGNLTWDRLKNNSLQIAPLSIFMGGGGQVGGILSEASKNRAMKANGEAFALKSEFNKLAPSQMNQFLFDMIQRQGMPFSKGYVASLFTSGHIDKTQLVEMQNLLSNSETLIKNANTYGLTPAQQKVYFWLDANKNKAIEDVAAQTDPIFIKAAEAKVKAIEQDMVNLASGEKVDYTVLTYPNNEQYVLSNQEAEQALKGNQFLSAYKNGDIKIETFGKRGAVQEQLDEIDSKKEPVKGHMAFEGSELNELETKAIEGLQGKDFAGSPIKPYTDVIQNPEASIEDKKEALKGLSDQLTAKGTEVVVGTALGKEADLIYDLGYEVAQESEALQKLQSEGTKIEEPTVSSAVIEIGGKLYEGKNHAEAILKAKADGQDISRVNRQAQGKFKLSDGTIIDRAEAKKRFGQDRSELMIEQDAAAEQANKDYRKITDPKQPTVSETEGAGSGVVGEAEKVFDGVKLNFETNRKSGEVITTKMTTKEDAEQVKYSFESTDSKGTSTTTSFPKMSKADFKKSSMYEHLGAAEKELIDEMPDDAIISIESATISKVDNNAAGLGNGNITIGYISKSEGLSIHDLVLKYQPNKKQSIKAEGAGSSGAEGKSDADIEKRMAEIEGDREMQDEFNSLEKEMEKRERASVFGVPLEKVNDAVDVLVKKEKDKPNGFGSFIETSDARKTKEVADKYSNAEEITDAELRKDFKDAVMGNPDTWYADGLKLRESMKEASNRGIDTKELIAEVEKEFVKDGYTPEDAKTTVAIKLSSIFKDSQKVNEKQLPTPKAEDKAPVNKPEGKSDVVVDKASNVGGDVETKQQIENFGVNKVDVEPVHSVISQVFSGLKKAGLTAAKTVGDWVGIGKGGVEKPYTLKMNGKDVQVKNTSPDVVNGFYSPLEKVITESKFDKLPAKQWQEKYANSEEAKWTGLKDWLAQQQGAVSKADIQQYLKDNRIQVVEVVKGEVSNFTKDDIADVKINQHGAGNWVVKTKEDGTVEFPLDKADDKAEAIEYALEQLNYDNKSKRESKPKFQQYQLEGEKENYREVLVTMPNDTKGYYALRKEFSDYSANKVPRKSGEDIVAYQDRYKKELENDKDYQALRQRMIDADKKQKEDFKSSHFDEPNILVHLRMSDRIDSEGNKVLHLSEIQSDWGQKGKKEGFNIPAKKNEFRKEKQSDGSWVVKDANNTAWWHGSTEERADAVINEYNTRETRIPKEVGAIPNAPFVTDTNQWVKLGLKTALKYAVKSGATKITWETGETQNARYDLSKQVDEIKYKPLENGQFEVSVIKDGSTLQKQVMKESELEGNFGKDVAKRIVNRDGDFGGTMVQPVYSLKDKNLSVGGKGMKGFYGSPTEGSLGIVGNVAKSLFKQEPKITEINTGKGEYTLGEANYVGGIGVYDSKGDMVSEFDTKKEANDYIKSKESATQHSIDITPELKASVEGGQPLFKDAEAQYRIESGKNIVEAIKDFSGSPRATVALTHEIMHPTVVAIIDGAKEGNEVGAKHTETIVNEFNKANPNNKVTTEDLIKGNDAFKDGTTSKQYRAVQEFIAKSWEKYHREGGKGFSEQFQKVLDQITQAFKSVYKSLTGKQLTPELRKMFDDILGKDQSQSKQESGGKAPVTKSEGEVEGGAKVGDYSGAKKELDAVKEKHSKFLRKDGGLRANTPEAVKKEIVDAYEKLQVLVKQERDNLVSNDKRDTGLVDGIDRIKDNADAMSLVKRVMDRGMIPERQYNDFGKNLLHIVSDKNDKHEVVMQTAEIIQDFISRANIKADNTLARELQAAENLKFELTENETKQEPTKDIKPEQAESQPQPEKTIVEDKQGAGKTKQQEIADKVRALKVNLSKLSGGGLQSNPLGLPVAVWNGAMDIVAKTIEVTGNVADAIQKGIKYIQKNHRGQWDKKGFNDQVLKELGVRGITVNGEDLIVKNDAKTEREYAKTVNGWYSDLEQSVLDVKGEQGRGENWIKVLGKSDEAKWTGLNDWLSQQKGKVSKADIQQYLRDNRIEIVEVVKGAVDYNAKNNNLSYTGSDDFVFLKDNGRNTNYEIRKKKAGFYDVYDNGENIGSRPTLDEAKELAEANFNAENGNPQIDKSASVKFDGYQLAGEKENYKEVLVTMPSATKVEMPKPIETYTGSGKYKLVFDNGNQLSGTYTKEEVADVLKRRSEDKTGMYIDRNEQFKSSHFEEPNILVHLRMNTRVDAEGKKVLFLEEVQSDWGQQGKKSGFANTEQISKLRDEETKLRDSVKKNKGKITADTPDDVYNKIRNENKLLEEQIYAIQTKITDLQSKSTPSAPFVTDTNAWTKLALKVALKEAVKQGAEKIGWTTGEQQNDRYDLSKQVDKIDVEKVEEVPNLFFVDIRLPDGTKYMLEIENGVVRSDSKYEGQRLEDIVGKDIAEKILNGGTQTLQGDGLKIGGKGMKGFYGSPTEKSLGIVGNVAKSLFKQEPKTIEIENSNIKKSSIGTGKLFTKNAVENAFTRGMVVKDYNGNILTKEEAIRLAENANSLDDKEYAYATNKESTSTQHSIDITPELKAEVEGGLPLFKDIKGRGKEIADLLRKGKIKLGGLQSNIAGLPIAVYNGAIEVIARALEGGATLTQAINRAYQKLKIKEKHKNFNQDEFIKKLEEATGEKFEDSEGSGKEPPIEPPKKEGVEGEGDVAGITHAANEVRRQDRALPEYQKEPQSFEQWNNEAEKAIKEGYDVEALMDRLEKGELGRDMPIEVENAIRKIYVATLDAEIAKNPTDALLAKQKRFIEIGDVVNSQLGRGLVSLKGEGSPLSSISDFYVAAMEAKNTDKLTDAEKAEVQKDYADVVAARQKAEKAEKEATAKYEEMKAENELLKQQLAAKNKAKSEKVYTNGKRDFKAEIKNYKDELIKAKEEHLKWMKDNGIQTSSIGGNKIVLNQKMAKIILKIAAVHVEQIGVKIAEVTKKTWEDVKDIFDGITEKDIWDVFNGVYNEKKLTRDNIVAQMRELKTEAKLLSEYENLLKKGEPKPEVEKQKRNQRLTDLRNKIDALKKEQGVGKYSDEAIAKRAIDANKRKMEDFSRRLREGEFEKEKQPTSIYEDIQFKKKNPKLYNELLDSQTKAHDAQLKFEKKLVEEEMKKWGLGDKLRNWAKKFSGTLKTLFASFDASAIAIQNLPFIAINPGIGVKGVARSYRGFLKQKAFDRYLQEIHSSPDWPMIRESIRITEPKSLLESGREEFFPDRFKAVVTIKGKQYGWIKVGDGKYELMDISKPFERQFTMLGNILRITKFRIEAEKLYQKGFTWEKNPEEFKTLGKRINNLTSSSDIPQAFQNEVTRTFIWSSRLIAAKLNMLGLSDVASMIPGLGVKKGYYRGLGVKGQIISRQQAYAAADLAKFATSVVIASYLYALARGGTLNTDPDDTGFLDVEYEAKDGSKKSMNFSGGFSRVISLIFQMASGGKRKDGVFRKYGGWSDPVKEAGRFVSGKAPPLTRTTLNIAAGKDMGGKEADIATEASNYKMPLAFGQIYKQIERDGLGALFTEGLLMYIGVNSKDSRDYDKKDNTISITDPETFKKRNVTPEEQKKYEETKEKGYNTLISDYERGKQTIWVDVNDDINIPNEDNFDKGKPKNLTVEEFDTWKEIKYSKLTPEQKKQLEGKAKRRSSAEAKKELFGVDEDE